MSLLWYSTCKFPIKFSAVVHVAFQEVHNVVLHVWDKSVTTYISVMQYFTVVIIIVPEVIVIWYQCTLDN